MYRTGTRSIFSSHSPTYLLVLLRRTRIEIFPVTYSISRLRDSASFSQSLSCVLPIVAFIPREEKRQKLERCEKFRRYNMKVSLAGGETNDKDRAHDKRRENTRNAARTIAIAAPHPARRDAFDYISLSLSLSCLSRFPWSCRNADATRSTAVIEFHGFAIISKVHDRR